MARLAGVQDSTTARIDQCQFGLWAKDSRGWALPKQPTQFLTNPVVIADELREGCPGVGPHAGNRHASLSGGRPKNAQIYPEALRGIKKQIGMDRKGQFLTSNVQVDNVDNAMRGRTSLLNQLQNNGESPAAREDLDQELAQAWGDVSGEGLDADKAGKARNKEIEYIKQTNPYTKVNRSKGKALGKKMVAARCVDVSKGCVEVEGYRSRLVAKEFNNSLRPDPFAAAPRLEAFKLAPSMLATWNQGQKPTVNDVSRAFFCAPARREVFAELPPEGPDHAKKTGELNQPMYGTRDAA